MAIDYSISKPTAGASRSTSPTEAEILTDISDTIAALDTRATALESGTYPVVANGGAAISDANFARPTGALVIWPMANGVVPVNAVFPDIINTADA